MPAATDVDLGIFLITPPVPHSIIYHTSDLLFSPHNGKLNNGDVNAKIDFSSQSLCVFCFAGCTGPFSPVPQRNTLSLIPGDNSFKLARGITAYFNDVQKEKVVSYELQSISERTTLIFFHESDLEVPGPLFELSHSELGVGEGQLLMVQPILSNTSFLPVETEFQSQCSRDSLSTLVRFTRLPYCLLISRADALYTAQHLPGKFLLEGDLLYHIGPNRYPPTPHYIWGLIKRQP